MSTEAAPMKVKLVSTEELRAMQKQALSNLPTIRGAKKPLVYIAGPYSKPDPVENMHRAIKIADGLLDVCAPMIPHLTGTWHMVSPKPYKEWLEVDLEFMRRCDAVYRFPGESTGADAEVAEARRVGIPVFYDEGELRAWAEGWA